MSFSTTTSAGAYTNLNGSYCDLHLEPAYLAYGVINDNSVSPSLEILTDMLGTAAATVYDLLVPWQAGFVSGYVQNTGVQLRGVLETGHVTLNADNNGSGNFTGGNAANSMKVTVYYSVESL